MEHRAGNQESEDRRQKTEDREQRVAGKQLGMNAG
jgi:hypothetical protein